MKLVVFSDTESVVSYASSVQPPPAVDSDTESDRYDNFRLNKDINNKESLGSKTLVPPRTDSPHAVLSVTSFHSQPLQSPPIPLQVKFADRAGSTESDRSTVREVGSEESDDNSQSDGIYVEQGDVPLSKYLNTYEPPQTTRATSKTDLGAKKRVKSKSKTPLCCSCCLG